MIRAFLIFVVRFVYYFVRGTPASMSDEWLRENERRAQQAGVDQSRWDVWPWKGWKE